MLVISMRNCSCFPVSTLMTQSLPWERAPKAGLWVDSPPSSPGPNSRCQTTGGSFPRHGSLSEVALAVAYSTGWPNWLTCWWCPPMWSTSPAGHLLDDHDFAFLLRGLWPEARAFTPANPCVSRSHDRILWPTVFVSQDSGHKYVSSCHVRRNTTHNIT